MFKRILIITILSLFVLTINSYADNCNRVRTVYPTYSAPTYYTPNYYQPYYKENIVFVPKAIEVEVHRDHYYSIDTYYQQSLLADAVVGRLLAIGIKGNEPRSIVANNRGNGSSNYVNSNTNVSSYQNQDLVIALKNNCAKCHDGKQRTAFLSSDEKLLALPKNKVLEIYHLVNTGKMPKSAAPLEDKYMPLIDQWVDASK